jgi:hypothetical protein
MARAIIRGESGRSDVVVQAPRSLDDDKRSLPCVDCREGVEDLEEECLACENIERRGGLRVCSAPSL